MEIDSIRKCNYNPTYKTPKTNKNISFKMEFVPPTIMNVPEEISTVKGFLPTLKSFFVELGKKLFGEDENSN